MELQYIRILDLNTSRLVECEIFSNFNLSVLQQAHCIQRPCPTKAGHGVYAETLASMTNEKQHDLYYKVMVKKSRMNNS